MNTWPAIDSSELTTRMLQLWLLDVSQTSPSLIAQARPWLSADELTRVARFKVAGAAERYILARGGLRWLLGSYLKLPPAELPLSTNPHGKPCLDPNPQNLQFNLSHSGDLILFGLARHPLGVDVEQTTRRPDSLTAIAQRFFSANEFEAFLATSPAQQVEAFYNGWTRKEAYLKALGTGISKERILSSFDVELRPGAEPRLLHVADDPAEVERWRMYALDVPDGYIAVAVAAATVTHTQMFWFNQA